MKNFIGYIIPSWLNKRKLPGRTNAIVKSLKIQVDNSLRLGWAKEDIIIVTNFKFEHMGVKAYTNDKLVPKNTRFLGKHFSLYWAMQRFEDDWWVHDHDTWQLLPFDLPEMKTDLCVYNFTGKKLGDSSFFIKRGAKGMMKDFVNYTISEAERFKKRKGGEVFWYQFIKEKKIPYDLLDWTYALRRSKFEQRYAAASKPIKAVHIKNKRTLLGFYCGHNPVDLEVDPKFIEVYKRYT